MPPVSHSCPAVGFNNNPLFAKRPFSICCFSMDCENLNDVTTSYGTFLGLRYRKGYGAVRLMYCTIAALALSLFRIIADLAMGFAIVHHSSWWFVLASLVDFGLAVTASAAGWFAVKDRRYGVIVFSIISFVETALYSAAYFSIVAFATWHSLCQNSVPGTMGPLIWASLVP